MKTLAAKLNQYPFIEIDFGSKVWVPNVEHVIVTGETTAQAFSGTVHTIIATEPENVTLVIILDQDNVLGRPPELFCRECGRDWFLTKEMALSHAHKILTEWRTENE